jgi:hypothetical protein
VTHYYSHLSVAAIQLERGTLRVGDVIHICGHSIDFRQKVESLEVDHAPATEVGPKDDFGLKVVDHAREHDVVFSRSAPGWTGAMEGEHDGYPETAR